MKIYFDLLILLNFFFDFILLVSVSVLLKRNSNFKRLILASLFGAISIVILFIPFNSFSLFIFKFITSLIMILIAFGFKSIKYTLSNILYLYTVSIIMGGFLYYINNLFSYKTVGMIFFSNGFSINWFLLIFLAPLSLYVYVLSQKKIKQEYNNYYSVEITLLNGEVVFLTGYLDTGNNLTDPYKNRPIIIVDKDIIKNYNPNYLLIPCLTVNNTSMIKAFKIKRLIIDNKIITKEVLVGISDNKFYYDGVDCLLSKKIL
ncbi:MAG: sigma-E processing peptidase SpoIIGA [Bacilli bacterium]